MMRVYNLHALEKLQNVRGVKMRILKRLPLIIGVALLCAIGLGQIWILMHDFSVVRFLIGLQSFIFGYVLLNRREEDGPSPYPAYIQFAIILSVGLPYLFTFGNPTPIIGDLISLAGVLLSMWSVISLGRAFGVAPADRGLVAHGPYRFIRHPMYAGYVITNLSVLIWNLTLWNLSLYVFIIITFVVRILLEERVVSDYDGYKEKVRWRIIPFIW